MQGRELPGPYANAVGEAFWRARVSITEFDRLTGIGRFGLSQIINGWRLPSATELDTICSGLKVEPTVLYGEVFLAAIEATRKAPAPEQASA